MRWKRRRELELEEEEEQLLLSRFHRRSSRSLEEERAECVRRRKRVSWVMLGKKGRMDEELGRGREGKGGLKVLVEKESFHPRRESSSRMLE